MLLESNETDDFIHRVCYDKNFTTNVLEILLYAETAMPLQWIKYTKLQVISAQQKCFETYCHTRCSTARRFPPNLLWLS